MFGKSAALLAALSLGASPVLAQASAQPLSIQPAVERAAPPMEGGNRLEGRSVFPVILLLAIVTGGVLMATGVIFDNHHPPRSP